VNYRNSTIFLAVVLLFVAVSYAFSQGQNKVALTRAVAKSAPALASQQIGSVPAGTAPAQDQIVDVRLWTTAQDSKALGLAIQQAVKNGEMKTTKTVDAALQRLRQDIERLAFSSRCPDGAVATITGESIHGPAVDNSVRVTAKCTCTFTLDNCGRGLMIVDSACPVHGSNSSF
jgi:hypothetical protein